MLVRVRLTLVAVTVWERGQATIRRGDRVGVTVRLVAVPEVRTSRVEVEYG